MPNDADIDWRRVENIMRFSITGGALNERDQAYIQAAYAHDKAKYGELHALIKDEEIEAVRNFGRRR